MAAAVVHAAPGNDVADAWPPRHSRTPMLHLEHCEALQERLIFFNLALGTRSRGDRDENRAHFAVCTAGLRLAGNASQCGIGSVGAPGRIAARLPDHSYLQLCPQRQLPRLPVLLFVPGVQVRSHGVLHRRHAQDLSAG